MLPTIPIPAWRSSAVATSTIVPPVNKTSKGALPIAASIPRARISSPAAEFIASVSRTHDPEEIYERHREQIKPYRDLPRFAGEHLKKNIAHDTGGDAGSKIVGHQGHQHREARGKARGRV